MLGVREVDESDEKEPEPGAKEVVASLAPLVAVPRKGVEQYVKLRSERSVENLGRILRQYDQCASARGAKPEKPDPPTVRPECLSARGPGKVPGVEATCGGGAASPSGQPNVISGSHTLAAQGLEKHWRETNLSWCTTTRAFFGRGGGGEAGRRKEKPVASGVFDEIWRPDRAEDLSSWRGTAESGDVESLANSMRGLKYVAERETGAPKTEQRSKYVRHREAKAHTVKKDRNLSQVPIGSIYSTDPWEIEAYHKRHTAQQESLRRIAKTQDEMRTAGREKKTEMQLICVNGEFVKRSKEEAEVATLFRQYPRKTQKTEYRHKYVAW